MIRCGGLFSQLADGVCLMTDLSKEDRCILIFDEHALIREAMSIYMQRVLPGATVLEFSSRHENFNCKNCDMSLILFGLRQPYGKAFAMLNELRDRFPLAPIVVIADTLDDRIIAMSRVYGVSGLFHSAGDAEDLLEVMRMAIAGKSVFPLDLHRMRGQGEFRFSPRQAEVLGLLCEGKSNKEIAARLNMSGNTVRTHISAIFNILGVRNRTEAVITGNRLI